MRPASIIQPEFACRTCRQHYGSRSILSIFFTSCIDFHPPCDVIRISVGNCRSNEAVNNGKTRRGNQLGSLMIRLIRTVPNWSALFFQEKLTRIRNGNSFWNCTKHYKECTPQLLYFHVPRVGTFPLSRRKHRYLYMAFFVSDFLFFLFFILLPALKSKHWKIVIETYENKSV